MYYEINFWQLQAKYEREISKVAGLPQNIINKIRLISHLKTVFVFISIIIKGVVCIIIH